MRNKNVQHLEPLACHCKGHFVTFQNKDEKNSLNVEIEQTYILRKDSLQNFIEDT